MDMDTSDSYLVVERMIREGKVSGAELPDLLATLESQELISREEHETLLLLAMGSQIVSPAREQIQRRTDASIGRSPG